MVSIDRLKLAFVLGSEAVPVPVPVESTPAIPTDITTPTDLGSMPLLYLDRLPATPMGILRTANSPNQKQQAALFAALPNEDAMLTLHPGSVTPQPAELNQMRGGHAIKRPIRFAEAVEVKYYTIGSRSNCNY